MDRGVTTAAAGGLDCVIVRAAELRCGIPLTHVVETLRPLPVDRIPGAPPGVEGLAVVRGDPTPVVSLRSLLGETPAPARRFVVLRTGSSRRVALAVDTVDGLARVALTDAPPLVARAAAGALEAVASLDGALMVVLEASRLLPDLGGP